MCREYPKIVPPVIVNGVEVMELCHCCFGAGERVIFVTAQVRVTIKEYRGIEVRIQRVTYIVCVPVENA